MSLVAALLVSILASFVATPSAHAADRPKIVVLGDSLTSGRGIGTDRAFPAVLQKQLDEDGYRLDVVNAGVSGDTSQRARRRLDEALRGDVRVLVVALGANDGLRGVPVDELKRNLSAIIEEGQQRGAAVLLCGMEALPVNGWNYSVAFHRAYSELAAAYDVPLVPFMMMNVLGNPGLMQRDRVHPNADGARVMAEHVYPYLERVLQAAGYERSST
jgi:acyl-CoA thioesterase-1